MDNYIIQNERIHCVTNRLHICTSILINGCLFEIYYKYNPNSTNSELKYIIQICEPTALYNVVTYSSSTASGISDFVNKIANKPETVNEYGWDENYCNKPRVKSFRKVLVPIFTRIQYKICEDAGI